MATAERIAEVASAKVARAKKDEEIKRAKEQLMKLSFDKAGAREQKKAEIANLKAQRAAINKATKKGSK